jgi:opacity protein-like surface antigen
MKMKLLVAAAATVVASSAMAQSAFEGAYGQLGIGYESTKQNFKFDNGATITNETTNSFASTAGLGYYFGVSSSFLLGVGAEYSFLPSSKSGVIAINGDPANSENSTVTKTSSYAVFVSPALAIDKDKLAYAKIGYSGSTFKIQGDGTPNTSNYNGYLFGLGYKQIIDGGLYGFAEGNYAMSIKKSPFAGQPVTVAPTSMNFMVGIGYKF